MEVKKSAQEARVGSTAEVQHHPCTSAASINQEMLRDGFLLDCGGFVQPSKLPSGAYFLSQSPMENGTKSSARFSAPWTVKLDPSGSGEHWLYDSDGNYIASVAFVHETEIDAAKSATHARLIVKSPQLLLRLKSILEDLKGARELILSQRESDSWMVTNDGWDALIHPTEALINEAEGR